VGLGTDATCWKSLILLNNLTSKKLLCERLCEFWASIRALESLGSTNIPLFHLVVQLSAGEVTGCVRERTWEVLPAPPSMNGL
jgi:hypothetical protein